MKDERERKREERKREREREECVGFIFFFDAITCFEKFKLWFVDFFLSTTFFFFFLHFLSFSFSERENESESENGRKQIIVRKRGEIKCLKSNGKRGRRRKRREKKEIEEERKR